MRLVITRLLRVKDIRNKISILDIPNNQSFIYLGQQFYTKRCYKFSTKNKEHIIDEKSQSLSILIMSKQLQINKQQSFKCILVHRQKIAAIGAKIIALIHQQIGFIGLHELKIAEYLSNINYPQNLREELDILIRIVQNFTIDNQDMNPYELDSKYTFLQYMQNYLLDKSQRENILDRISDIIECEIKFKETLSYFKSYNGEQNIINTHPNKYPQTWRNIYVLTYSNKSTMSKGYNDLANIFNFISSAIMMKHQMHEKSQGFQLYFRFLKQNWRNLYSLLFFKKFNIQNGKELFNLFEQKPFKKIVQLSYDAIKTNQFIYIPADGNFESHVDLFKQSKDSIPVRVLYYKQLPLIKGTQDQNYTDYIEDIVVHMHGGGFVVLSSHTTQNYTRKWANELKIPVFSIDYRMAPDHAFPQAPNDCFQVYKFLTSQLYKYMKIKPVNVFLGGDSAGANLSCAVTTLALKNQLLIPKSMYLAYPPVNMDFIYYPSRKYILNDPSLWPTMIKTFMNSYLTNQDDLKNPLASPIFLTEQFIIGKKGDTRFPIKWPKTYITVGMKDPLRDQCLLFIKRMTDSNINCKCFIYEHMSHGFLSTDQIIKDTSKTITHSIQLLKELIAASKNNKK